ncbi:MAG: DUF1800 family protein [Terriglobales bacterium]
MRRRVILASFLGWMILLTGCAGGKLTMFSGASTLQVSASTSTVRAGDTLQLAAASATAETGAVSGTRWSVNGIRGGNLMLGTIDDNGRYTAPASLPANNKVTISAERGGASSSLTVTLWNPIPEIASVTARDAGDSIELSLSGHKFVAGARVNVGGTIYPSDPATLTTTQLKVKVPASAVSGASVEISAANVEPGAAFSDATYFSWGRPTRPSRGNATNAAARFLTQASFGATTTEVNAINALRTNLGTMTQALNQYVDNQMNPAVVVPSTWPDIPVPFPTNPNNPNQMLCGNSMQCAQILWFQNALLGNDQLRQRTAFAMSQIWVISGNTVQQSDSYLTYYRILNDRAFGNYYQIMDEVTRSSGMGYYLDMGNSAKAANGGIANENYARELLQLFTVGLYMLNEDGTFQHDGNGERIPTYTEEDVQEFARALTGWTYKRVDNQVIWNQNFSSGATDRGGAMVVSATNHDTGAKTLLQYSGALSPTLQAGNTAQQDLTDALQNIFNHPSLPPFISMQLIQHLVTSNPSPAYVQRVVDKFKNNGSGVRGDMAAVIKAILLDEEARGADLYLIHNTSGHLREPVLYVSGILRNLGFSTAGAVTYTSPAGNMTNIAASMPRLGLFMGQNVLHSPSVFNYFTPDYSIQGGTLLGPEFQLQTTANAPVRANFVDSLTRNQYTSSAIDVSASFTSLVNMATNPAQLVDQLDQQFMHGQMSAPMRQTIIDRVAAMPSVTTDDRTFRARTALYLVISSSQYQVAR